MERILRSDPLTFKTVADPYTSLTPTLTPTLHFAVPTPRMISITPYEAVPTAKCLIIFKKPFRLHYGNNDIESSTQSFIKPGTKNRDTHKNRIRLNFYGLDYHCKRLLWCGEKRTLKTIRVAQKHVPNGTRH